MDLFNLFQTRYNLCNSDEAIRQKLHHYAKGSRQLLQQATSIESRADGESLKISSKRVFLPIEIAVDIKHCVCLKTCDYYLIRCVSFRQAKVYR